MIYTMLTYDFVLWYYIAWTFSVYVDVFQPFIKCNIRSVFSIDGLS